MICLKKLSFGVLQKKLQSENRLAKALDYTRYSGKHGESPLGKASKFSLHVMRRYLKASHMCAIAQCHEASLCTYVCVHIPLAHVSALHEY